MTPKWHPLRLQLHQATRMIACVSIGKHLLHRPSGIAEYQTRLFFAGLGVMLAAVAGVNWLPVVERLGWGLWFGSLFALVWIADYLACPKLSCPACRQEIRPKQVGKHCPECGCGQVKHRWPFSPVCGACGKAFENGKHGCNWSLRACPHCGVIICPEGIKMNLFK